MIGQPKERSSLVMIWKYKAGIKDNVANFCQFVKTPKAILTSIHDEPERDKNNSVVQEPQDLESTADEKSTKGELNIKTVSLPKRV